VKRDSVAPQRAPGAEQALAERAAELVERAPAGGRDLVGVLRCELLVLGSSRDDVGSPLDRPAAEANPCLARDQIALELDLDAQLLQRLATDPLDRVFARADAAATTSRSSSSTATGSR